MVQSPQAWEIARCHKKSCGDRECLMLVEIAVVMLLAYSQQRRQKIVLMTLWKCANSLGLQVQSVVAREFTHKGDLGFNIELSGNKGKAYSSLV
jgi:hypothetical protein